MIQLSVYVYILLANAREGTSRRKPQAARRGRRPGRASRSHYEKTIANIPAIFCCDCKHIALSNEGKVMNIRDIRVDVNIISLGPRRRLRAKP